MKTMPLNPIKENIHDILAFTCISNQYKRIFSLIGTQAGLVSKLPDVDVVSAEIQSDVFIMQRLLYPHYKLYPTKASYALFVEQPFDFIWLDFFGNAFEGDNWASCIIASKKLNESGMIAVTSNRRTSQGGVHNAEQKFKLLGLTIVKQFYYRNYQSNLDLFILQ